MDDVHPESKIGVRLQSAAFDLILCFSPPCRSFYSFAPNGDTILSIRSPHGVPMSHALPEGVLLHEYKLPAKIPTVEESYRADLHSCWRSGCTGHVQWMHHRQS